MLTLRPEQPADRPLVESLLDRSFGSDRERKISYRYRTGREPIHELCLVAQAAGMLVGAIRYWPVELRGRPALLLGPVAIEPVDVTLAITTYDAPIEPYHAYFPFPASFGGRFSAETQNRVRIVKGQLTALSRGRSWATRLSVKAPGGKDAPLKLERLEVNGNIQIHERNSNVAGLMITQSSGDTGYIMHNRGNTLTLGAGSVDRLTITSEGNVGFSVNRPAHPIELANGAHVTAGGVWTNSSSIANKENVRELSPEEALTALARLAPVRFNYKAEQDEEYLGFIAEDVPELVATADRSGLSAMDIVAVLTSVVQQQQKQIAALEARLGGEVATH